jgi:hypothetical protein
MAVAVDPFGDVAASGIMNKNFGVVKLNGTSGLEAWQREINGAGNFSDAFEEANSVAMDSDGSVIAAGITSNRFADPRDFTVAKYTPGGDLQWVRALDGGWCEINDHGEVVCQSNDEAHAVALGSDGSVFAAGSLQTDGNSEVRGANEHFHVVKFSSDGGVIWSEPAQYPLFGAEYTRGRAVTLSVDAAGNAVAAGMHNERFTVVKFTGSGNRAGERVWLQQSGEPPTPGNSTTATDVATDADDNVVAGGELLGPDNFSNFTVVKFRGTDGGSYFRIPNPAASNRFDFDGDQVTDIAVWRPTDGNWYIINSSDSTMRLLPDWGRASLGDLAVPADYDGDRKTDIAVWRSSEGNWYVINSSNGLVRLQQWGDVSDKPVPGDYDGDGKADFAVYRPSEGNWYILKSTGGITLRSWGTGTDKPVPGDYDGDGRTDIAVYRPSEGNWYIINSLDNSARVQGWGTNDDRLVPADYDGDGKTDLAVFRSSEANWYILKSSGGVVIRNWGGDGDVLVPGDYDGDLKADIAVWRPSEANWYIIKSTDNTVRLQLLGSDGDIPVPSVYLPQ